MAIERALVIQLDGDQALVRTQRTSACQSCELNSSCGQGLLSKIGSERTMEVWLDNVLGAQPGQVVSISVPDEGLLKASALMFLMPLATLIAFATLAFSVVGSDTSAILGGIFGLFVGFGLARHQSATMEADVRFKPTMESLELSNAEGGACTS